MFRPFRKKATLDPECEAQAIDKTVGKLIKQFKIAESLYVMSNQEIADIIRERVEAQMMFLSFEAKVFDFCLQDAYHDKHRTRSPEDLPRIDQSMLPSLRDIWLQLIDDPVASMNLRMRYQLIFERGALNYDEQELWRLMENISAQTNLHFIYDQDLSLTWLDFIVSLRNPNPAESMRILHSNQS